MTRGSRKSSTDFFLLWQGSVVSALGTQAYHIAIMLWAKQATGSGTVVGLIMFAGGITGVLMPLGGVLADRLPRARTLVVLDFLSGLCVLTLSAIFFMSRDSHGLMIAAVIAINFVRGICTSLFHPVADALLPDLVDRPVLSRANSRMQTSLRVTTLIGQSVGGILFRVLGAPLLLLVDGLSFLASAVSEMFIREPEREARPEGQQRSSIWSELKVGWQFTGRVRGMRIYLLEASCANLCIAALFVCLPFYVEDVLDASEDWYGYLLGAMGLGAIIGGVVAGRFSTPGVRRGTIHLTCILLLNGSAIPLALAPSPRAALAVAVFAWACVGFHQVILTTLIQKRTPQSVRGRVFGLMSMIRSGLTPLGIAIFGIVIDQLDGQVTPVLFGTGGAAFAIGLVALCHPDFRHFFTGDEDEVGME